MEKISRRKITQMGKDAGFRVTLPPVWCWDMGISGGDLVEIWRDGDQLIIKAIKEEENGKGDG